MKIIFMGTPEFSVPSLNMLVEAGHNVCAVYTQPPRPAGRKMALTPSPIQQRAEALGIPVFTPKSLKAEEDQFRFAAFGADIAIVAAYGLLLPQAILDAPKLGCVNVHASILPRWRGAAPIQRAILAGDTETGVTLMQMEAGLDTGPMLAMSRTPVAGKTAPDLTRELAAMGAELLLPFLENPTAFETKPQPDQGVTHAPKIDKSESQLDFLISAAQVERQIRAFYPTAWFVLAGERFRILSADVLPPNDPANGHAPATLVDDHLTIACNPGALRVTQIQRAGKSPMVAADLLRGFPMAEGTRLG